LIPGELEERLRTIGGEFGATTGRARKCGWLDLQLIKYGKWLNNYTSFNVTKLDCLANLGNLDVVVGYEIDGKRVHGMPAQIDDMWKIKCVTETLKGWTEDISQCRKWEEMPLAAREYIEFIEKETGTPVTWIGVGPEREAMILREHN